MRHALAVSLVALAMLPGCQHGKASSRESAAREDASEPALSSEEGRRKKCALEFAACAPPASFAPDLDVNAVSVKTLVALSSRLDVPDDLTETAAKRLRKLAERGDLQIVREIAAAADTMSPTLGRCRCEGTRYRSAYETQAVGAAVAGRLPPAELADPVHWFERIDPHLSKLRALSRRSAEILASGDEAAAAELDAQFAAEEGALCEYVHAARDALAENGLEEVRDLVVKARTRESGEASVDVARRALEKAERQISCALPGRPAAVE